MSGGSLRQSFTAPVCRLMTRTNSFPPTDPCACVLGRGGRQRHPRSGRTGGTPSKASCHRPHSSCRPLCSETHVVVDGSRPPHGLKLTKCDGEMCDGWHPSSATGSVTLSARREIQTHACMCSIFILMGNSVLRFLSLS